LKKIAVIGTGLSALSLAHHLPPLDITFFEKSWRPGGRLSTRRQESYEFDHGAHFLKEDHGMIGLTEFLQKIKAIKFAETDFCSNILHGQLIEKKTILIGQKGIESIPIKFHDFLKYPTYFSTQIEKIENNQKEYFLRTKEKIFGPFDYVFCCIPFEQSKNLLSAFIDFKSMPEVKFDSIWTVMLALNKRLGSPFQFGYHLTPEISFIMNQNFKHEFFNEECWVVNMRSEWTHKYYSIEPYVLEDYVSDQIKKAFKSDAKVTFKKSHRWRYAYTKQSFKEISQRNFIQSIDKKLYALGDWCEGPSMQDAWLAGKKLAKFFKDLQLQG